MKWLFFLISLNVSAAAIWPNGQRLQTFQNGLLFGNNETIDAQVDQFNLSGGAQLSGALLLEEEDTQSDPGAGFGKIYFKSDSRLYQKDSSGEERSATAPDVTTETTVEPVNVTEIVLPNNQATRIATSSMLLETRNQNRLRNPGFEHQAYQTGWTVSGLATVASTSLAAQVVAGAKSFRAITSANTVEIFQDSTLYAATSNRQLYASIIASNTAVSARVCPRVNGAVVVANCIFLDTTGSSTVYEIMFIGGTTSNGIQVDAGSSTGTIVIDDAYVGPPPAGSIYEAGSVGEWIDYGPMTITATTTNPTKATVRQRDKVRCRQVGGNYECEFKYSAASAAGSAPGSGQYIFNLPPGIEISSDIPNQTTIGDLVRVPLNAGDIEIVGYSSNPGTMGDVVSAVKFSQTSFRVVGQALHNSISPISASYYGINIGNLSYSFTVKFRGQNLNARTNLYSQQCVRQTDCENVFSAKVSGSGVVTGDTLDFINGNCVITGSGATSRVTCTYNTSIFTANPVCTATIDGTTTGVNERAITLNSNSTSSFVIANFVTPTNVYYSWDQSVSVICTKSPPDYKFRNIITGTFQDVVTSPGAIKVVLCSVASAVGNTLSRDLGGCVASSSGTAVRTFTFAAGYWAEAPNCSCNVGHNSGSGTSCAAEPASTSSVVVRAYNNNITLDETITLFCHGKIP
jgi:hypothetical protein